MDYSDAGGDGKNYKEHFEDRGTWRATSPGSWPWRLAWTGPLEITKTGQALVSSYRLALEPGRPRQTLGFLEPDAPLPHLKSSPLTRKHQHCTDLALAQPEYKSLGHTMQPLLPAAAATHVPKVFSPPPPPPPAQAQFPAQQFHLLSFSCSFSL